MTTDKKDNVDRLIKGVNITIKTYIILVFLAGGFLVGYLVAYYESGNCVPKVVEVERGPIVIQKEIVKEPCNLSCLDARNEGYLDGVAECGMNAMYVIAVDGRIRSYVNNTEGFYSSDGVMCLQVEGRTSDQILGTVVHELMHKNVYEGDINHFCGGDE